MANSMARGKSEQLGTIKHSPIVIARANPLERRMHPLGQPINSWWARTVIVLFLALLPTSNLEIGKEKKFSIQ